VWDIPVAVQEVLRKYCPSNFYYQWLNHPENDAYWQELSPQTYWKKENNNIDLPMLHIGGWFDGYLRGTWNFYQQISQISKFQQTLIIGAWGHFPWGSTLGDVHYTSSANNYINEIQIAWFNKYLKGLNSDTLPKQDVNLFEMNGNKWLSYKSLNSVEKKEFYLQSKGLANLRNDDGKLSLNELKNIANAEDIIVQDFWRPVPSLGGHASIPSGSLERSELDNRSDIITYTSDIFTENFHLKGEIELEIYIFSDSKIFDLSATLSEVFSDGKVYNFSQGYIQVKDHRLDRPVRFKLQPTCIKINKNSSMSLSISCTCFPAYLVNTGSGEIGSNSNNLDGSKTSMTVSILSGNDYPSKVIVSL